MKALTLGGFVLAVLLLPFYGQAEGVSFSNNPLLAEQPVWFESDGADGFYGSTTGGYTFTQKPINNVFNLRIHKFIIGDLYFYVSDKGIIEAGNDLVAISIYLARA